MAKDRAHVKRKIFGAVIALVGIAGLVYAGMSQFVPGGDKQAAAGTLLFSLIVLFIGIGQFFRKDQDEYYN